LTANDWDPKGSINQPVVTTAIAPLTANASLVYGSQNTGFIRTGACTGVFALQWAQSTSSAACTTLKNGSALFIKKA
jgi:hypothetical protein